MIRTVLVDGQAVEVDVSTQDGTLVEVQPGLFSVIRNGRSYLARVVAGGVEVNGQFLATVVVDPRAMTQKGPGSLAEGKQTLTAPMPGKIVRVLVAEGDSVEAGTGILVIEAMKMQNELKCQRSGTVTALPVRQGNPVAQGDVLAVIE